MREKITRLCVDRSRVPRKEFLSVYKIGTTSWFSISLELIKHRFTDNIVREIEMLTKQILQFQTLMNLDIFRIEKSKH